MSYYEHQFLTSRLRGRGLLFDLASRMVGAWAQAYKRDQTLRSLQQLDDRLLDDIGLERGPNGYRRRNTGAGE
ncbi:DUF1127 domain-containing protein [Roseibium sediminis]|uniref:DUF1127 domain-containing protein n=1 Tax=Roseibium sediminis TaxID=1775174 RepID=UPI00123D1DCC|nr:DUF1127 domain-containing protein [Roseibium sediminis]